MQFKIIVTLGPSLLNPERLKTIDALGQCIYRINGAYGSDEVQVRDYISRVRTILPQARILIDLPGNKVRTAHLEPPIRLSNGEDFVLRPHEINYPEFCTLVKPGHMISAYDSTYTFEVLEATKEAIRLRSHSDGFLHSNRGLHVKGVNDVMPFLFEKDCMLMRVAKKENVNFLGLSYVRSGHDIQEVKQHLGATDIQLIAKVETVMAVQNLYNIFQEVRTIIIDRGDLSSAVGLLNIASVQSNIIEAARRAQVEVYLATQFLKNMEQYPVPLIAEVIDLCQTMRLGIAGIQLSEETAVGKYPVECVKLVFEAFRNSFNGAKF